MSQINTARMPSASVPNEQAKVRQAFQEFVSGTFFRQMIKSLRSAQGEPAYFHGGQAERIFQGQFDEQIADDLASKHGEALAEPLFKAFEAQRTGQPLTSIKRAASEAAAGYSTAKSLVSAESPQVSQLGSSI